MMTHLHPRTNRLRLVVLAVAPGSICLSAPAIADTRMGMDLSAGGSVESNPYLTGSRTDVAASLQVDPWLRVTDEVSSVDFRSNLTLRRYSQNANGTDLSGTASLATSRRLSPYVSLNGGLNYSTSRNGINLGFANVGPNDPPPPSTTPLPDIALAGTRTRTQTIDGNLGISARLSPLDELGASFNASRTTNNSRSSRDYNYLNGGINYSHTLSERTSITGSVRYGRSNYVGTRTGDGTIITPEIGLQHTVSATITLSASLGASFTRSTNEDGSTTKGTTLSGQARVCRIADRAGMCLIAARSAQPTSLGNISTVTSVAISYDKRISRRDSIGVSVNFAENSDAARLNVTRQEASKFYTASATWSRNFNPRLSAYLNPSYSRVVTSSNSRDSFRLSAGLRLRFGAIS